MEVEFYKKIFIWLNKIDKSVLEMIFERNLYMAFLVGLTFGAIWLNSLSILFQAFQIAHSDHYIF